VGNTLTAAATFLTALGVGAAVWQLRQNGQDARAQFEEALTARYREIVNRLPVWSLFDLDELTPEQRARIAQEQTMSAFYQYFDLCNEQVFLHDKERLDPKTWEEWRKGIAGNLRRKSFRTAWVCHIKPHVGEDFQEFKALSRDLRIEERRRRAEQRRGRPLAPR
jgi:hypothetical protein